MAGALPEAERAAIANHAAVCEGCHALIEGLVGTAASCATVSGSGELRASRDDCNGDGDGDGNGDGDGDGDGDGGITWMHALDRGTRVGRYVIDRPLGAGGMSVVHAALDSELHRQVALKLLRRDPRGSTGGGGRDRLMREARSLARLAHPNVVTVFDVGEHRDQLFIAMELVGGGSLNAWLRRTPRTTDEIIDCLLGAGRGLAASHAAGIVHRDVKPDNILVGFDGRARLTDFGLARLGDAPPPWPEAASVDRIAAPLGLTRTGTLVGTPAYMAPEQLMRGEACARSDQWSFCATLYEALAGVRPFTVEDVVARASAIAEGRLAAPAPGHRVPGWVRPIVARGLHVDPAARWPSMNAVVQALVLGRRRNHLAAAIAGIVAIAGAAIQKSRLQTHRLATVLSVIGCVSW